MKVGVVGAGSWGTAVAGIISDHADVVLWARRAEVADSVNTEHVNAAYLPDLQLPESLVASTSLEAVVRDADVVVMGVPSHGVRDVLTSAREWVGPSTPVVSLSKGMERETKLRGTQVILEVLEGHDTDSVGVLSGPNLAREVVAGQPAASVIAMEDESIAADLQGLFMTPTFRVYTNPDVIGCEIAGALKNVMAIAAGIASGLGYGDNTMAALLTRGLAELTRLGLAAGGHAMTFGGLAGVGDLIATCTSEKSRNRTVGYELGKGRSLDEITSSMNMVAEGVKSTAAVLELAHDHDVEMPIAEQVGAVLYEGREPQDIVPALMLREAKSEAHGLAEARRHRDA
ncbi:MAG: NAD(P)H-dependent glycerol-3-phosphate dehydrogenase [Acidimicrobiia bacterium]